MIIKEQFQNSDYSRQQKLDSCLRHLLAYKCSNYYDGKRYGYKYLILSSSGEDHNYLCGMNIIQEQYKTPFFLISKSIYY